MQFCLEMKHCTPYKAACHPTKYDVFNDVKLFATVYRMIYCCELLTLSNQMSRFKSTCIRVIFLTPPSILIFRHNVSFLALLLQLLIGVAPITQVTHVHNKIVIFTGGHTM